MLMPLLILIFEAYLLEKNTRNFPFHPTPTMRLIPLVIAMTVTAAAAAHPRSLSSKGFFSASLIRHETTTNRCERELSGQQPRSIEVRSYIPTLALSASSSNTLTDIIPNGQSYSVEFYANVGIGKSR